MKNKLTILSAACLLMLVGFKAYKFDTDYEDIGTIKQSLLKEDPFNRTQKGVWVLLRGQELDQESELFKILKQQSEETILEKKGDKYYLPDARGRFIRSSNDKGVGGDPDKNRVVGSYQADTLKKHSHGYKSSAKHDVSAKGSNSEYAWDPADYTTAPYGGDETRPKNISMYTYIKVSK